MLTILDPATGRTTALSQVDPATCEMLVTATRRSSSSGFDPVVIRAVVDEVAEYGPPRPIHNDPAPVELESAPFRARWGEFELAHASEAFALNFIEPDDGRRCRFRLQLIHPRIHFADIAIIGSESMDYLSCPRLDLHGYAYIFGLREHLDDRVARIRQHLESYLPRTINDAAMVRFAGPAHGK